MDLIKKIANIPVVNRAYNPECNVYFVVGMVRMLKHVNSCDSADQKDHFDTLIMITDCFDNDAIAEVIELGCKFTTNIDDAKDILFFNILARRAQGKLWTVYINTNDPIDRHVAFGIKSGLLESVLNSWHTLNVISSGSVNSF